MRSEQWATPDQIKQVLTQMYFSPDNILHSDAGGAVLLCENSQLWACGCDGHSLYLGTTGSGKSRRGTYFLEESLLAAGESFIAVDPKGELHKNTVVEAERRGYEVHVVNFRGVVSPTGDSESEGWNPLSVPYEMYRSTVPLKRQFAMECIDEMSHSLFPISQHEEPFWAESARSLFVGACYIIMELAPPEEVNLASVYQLIVRGDAHMGLQSYLQQLLEILPADSVGSMLIQSYVNTAKDTQCGIRSTFLEGMSIFARSEGIMRMTSNDNLHINALPGDRPCAIYLILPDESPVFDRLAGVLVEQIMSHYIRLAHDKFDGCLPIRMNVCLEELGNIGKAIGNLPHLMTAGRSRGLRCHLVLQALSQLTDIYGSSRATTILSNVDVLIAYRTSHWETLVELSRKCGEREVKRENIISSEPLITPSQLGAMETGQALVIINGKTKYITWLPDFSEVFGPQDSVKPNGLVYFHPKPQTFDIVKYIKEFRTRGADAKQRASLSECRPSNAPSTDVVFMPNVLYSASANQPNSKFDYDKVKRPYGLIVRRLGKNMNRIIHLMATALVVDQADLKKHLQKLPATIYFPIQNQARSVCMKITDLGGIAVLEDDATG